MSTLPEVHKLLKYNKVHEAEDIMLEGLQQYLEEGGVKNRKGGLQAHSWPKTMIKVFFYF